METLSGRAEGSSLFHNSCEPIRSPYDNELMTDAGLLAAIGGGRRSASRRAADPPAGNGTNRKIWRPGLFSMLAGV